eukprot:c56228_g1_i1 orf=155-310(+)
MAAEARYFDDVNEKDVAKSLAFVEPKYNSEDNLMLERVICVILEIHPLLSR